MQPPFLPSGLPPSAPIQSYQMEDGMGFPFKVKTSSVINLACFGCSKQLSWLIDEIPSPPRPVPSDSSGRDHMHLPQPGAPPRSHPGGLPIRRASPKGSGHRVISLSPRILHTRMRKLTCTIPAGVQLSQLYFLRL